MKIKTQQTGTSRRNALVSLLSTPAMALKAASATILHNGTINPPRVYRDVVTQHELQAVIDQYNRCEVLAAAIRLRLESGAEMEHGKLGVDTHGQDSLKEYSERGIGCNDGVSIVGLSIEKVEDIQFVLDLLEQHPDYPYKGITLV